MEGDTVNQWIDVGELRSLAESLMAPTISATPSAPEAVYGEHFIGYAEVGARDPRKATPSARDAALKTLSEARGTATSAGIVTAPVAPAPASPPPAPRNEPVFAKPVEEQVQPKPAVTPSGGAIESPFRVAGAPTPKAAIPTKPAQPNVRAIASSPTPTGQPLVRRMHAFGLWLKQAVPAEAFFVCDRNGEIISDEVGNEKLLKVARTLAHASSSASRQMGEAGGLGSPHVKIGVDRILQVIPKRSKFGLVVLGVIVPSPLSKELVAAIAQSLSKTLGDEVLVPV